MLMGYHRRTEILAAGVGLRWSHKGEGGGICVLKTLKMEFLPMECCEDIISPLQDSSGQL